MQIAIAGKPTAGQVIVSTRFGPTLTLSQSESFATAEVASTGTAVCHLAVDGTPIGTITFTTSKTGVISITNPVIPSKSLFEIDAPGTQDATLAQITLSLAVAR